MRLTVRQSDLAPAAAAAARIAKSESIPIVTCARLTAIRARGVSHLEVTATDLDLSHTITIPADVAEPGVAVVSAAVLAAAMKSLPDEDVEIATDDQAWSTLRCGETQYRLAGLPPADFPAMPDGKAGARSFDLPAPVLARLVARVRMAITAEDARYYLSGAHLTLSPTRGLGLAATDGHRLSATWAPLETPPASELSQLIPRAAVDELPGLLADAAVVTFRVSDTLLSWEAGGRLLTVKTVEGTFPTYEQKLAEARQAGSSWSAAIDRLNKGIDRVRALRGQKHGCVLFQFGAGALRLKTESPDVGTATDLVPMEGWQLADLAVGLNATYVLDWLRAAHAEGVAAVRGRAVSQEAGVLFEPAADGVDWLYYVMPMRF